MTWSPVHTSPAAPWRTCGAPFVLGVLLALVAPAHVRAADGTAHPLTAQRLTAALNAAVHMRAVPAVLDPPLATAAGARPLIYEAGCALGVKGVKSPPCAFGDTNAR